MSMIEERIKLCLTRHPDWTSGHVAKSLGLKTVAVEALRGPAPEAPALATGLPEGGLISLDRIKARYDIKAAILRELGKLGKGKLISENDLSQRAAGNDRNRFRRTVENNADDFEPHRIKLRLDDSADGKFYWGGRDDIAEAKRIRDL